MIRAFRFRTGSRHKGKSPSLEGKRRLLRLPKQAVCFLLGQAGTERDAMQRTITGFEQDEEGHWVALLSCGHRQHMRHKPPFIERPWVIEPRSRNAKIGEAIECPLCDQDR